MVRRLRAGWALARLRGRLRIGSNPFRGYPSPSLRDLFVEIRFEILQRHVIGMWFGPIDPLEDPPAVAGRAAAQVITNLPQHVVKKPVAD